MFIDFKQIWEDLKSDAAWIKNKWLKFESWFNLTVVPGLKVKIVNALSAIGVAATGAAAYMKEVPLDTIVSAKTVAIAMFVVATLSYWLRGIGDRTEDISDVRES